MPQLPADVGPVLVCKLVKIMFDFWHNFLYNIVISNKL